MKKLILSLIIVIGGATTAQGQFVSNTGAEELLDAVRDYGYIGTETLDKTPVYMIPQNDFYEKHIANLAVNNTEFVGNWEFDYIYVDNLLVVVQTKAHRKTFLVWINEYDDILIEP